MPGADGTGTASDSGETSCAGEPGAELGEAVPDSTVSKIEAAGKQSNSSQVQPENEMKKTSLTTSASVRAVERRARSQRGKERLHLARQGMRRAQPLHLHA